MDNYIVKCTSGQVFQFRRHDLANLATKDQTALCFEPTLVSGDVSGGSTLLVSSDAAGFQWRVTSRDGFGVNDRSSAVSIQGRTGGRIRYKDRFPLEGESIWNRWPGCRAIDLVIVDDDDNVSGTSVSLMIPRAVGPDMEFSLCADERYALVKPRSHGTAPAELVAWHRVQNGKWREFANLGAISEHGITVPVPSFQGAFAVVCNGSDLQSAQFFGFGALQAGKPQDFEQFEALYQTPTEVRERWEAWPAWVQHHLIGELERFVDLLSPSSVDPDRPDCLLREIVRRELLGRFLPNTSIDWHLDLTIEAFASAQWPNLRKVIGSVTDKATLLFAFSERGSPLLQEAVEWADDQMQFFGDCLRLAPIRVGYRAVFALLPTDSESNRVACLLRSALDSVPRAGRGAEPRVRELWDDLKQAVACEFHVTLEALKPEIVSEVRCLKSLREVASELGIAVHGESISDCLDEMSNDLEGLATLNIPELVNRCMALGLFPKDVNDLYSEKQIHLGAIINAARDAISGISGGIYAGSVDRFCRVSSKLGVAAALAARSMASHINSNTTGILADRARTLGMPWNEIPDCTTPVQRVLALVIQQHDLLEARHSELDARQAQFDALGRHLPDGIDPDSSAAEEFIRHRALAVIARAKSLMETYLEEISLPEQRRLSEAQTDLADVLNVSGPDRLQRLQQQCIAIQKWDESVTRIGASIASREAERSQVPEALLNAMFEREQFDVAKRITRVAEVGRAVFGRGDLLTLLWLHEDRHCAEQLLTAGMAIRDLDRVQNEADVANLELALGESKALIKAQGGLSKLIMDLHDCLHVRWLQLYHDCFQKRTELENATMIGRLLRAAGADTYGLNGPPIEDSAYFPAGLSSQALRENLKRHRLWPVLEKAVQ